MVAPGRAAPLSRGRPTADLRRSRWQQWDRDCGRGNWACRSWPTRWENRSASAVHRPCWRMSICTMCSTSGSSGGGGAGSRRGHRRALCGRLRHDTGDADAERFGLEPPFWTAQFDFNPQARKDSCCSRCRQPLRRSVATGSSTSCPRVALCAFVASLWRALNGAGARHRQQPRVRLGPPARVRSLPVWQLLLLSPPAHPPCRDAVAGCVWHRRGQIRNALDCRAVWRAIRRRS